MFAIGHPGSGKSSTWQTIYEESRETYLDETIPDVDAFVRIDPDEFLLHNPFFVQHLRERVAAASADGTVTLNPNVVGNRTIRRMMREGVDQLFRLCVENQYSFVYETLWQDPDYYLQNVYLPTRESFKHVFVYVFQNDSLEDVTSGIAKRAEATGRYVPDVLVREKWEEGMRRTLLDPDVKYTGGSILQALASPSTPYMPANEGQLIQTTNEGIYESKYKVMVLNGIR